MTIFAYLYSEPLLESPPDPLLWGFEVDRLYQDMGQRQQLQQLLIDCKQKPPQYLLVRRLEELGDNIQQIGDRLTELESLNIEIVVIEQDYTTSKFKQNKVENNRQILTSLLIEIQKEKQSKNLRKGHAKNRLKGLPPPGKAPFGYRKGQDKYIIDKANYTIVKDFFERFLLYGSLRGAVRYLETKYNKKISPSTGKKWLTNPVYRGNLQYHNGEIIANTHNPIISQEEAAQIDRLLRKNSKIATRSATANRSLAGLLVCEKCNSTMTITKVTSHNEKQEYLYIRPVNCQFKPKCKAISYQEILGKIIEQICIELPEAVSKLQIGNLNNITVLFHEQILAKEKIIKQLSDLENQGILDEETARLREYKLRTEIAQLQAKLSQLPPANLTQIAQTISFPQFWLDLSESERRFYFREFIKQIYLIPNSPKNWELKLVFIF
jgi:DNA invertase Pin-like site-specific DNA recombinase/predicted metal-binding protein